MAYSSDDWRPAGRSAWSARPLAAVPPADPWDQGLLAAPGPRDESARRDGRVQRDAAVYRDARANARDNRDVRVRRDMSVRRAVPARGQAAPTRRLDLWDTDEQAPRSTRLMWMIILPVLAFTVTVLVFRSLLL